MNVSFAILEPVLLPSFPAQVVYPDDISVVELVLQSDYFAHKPQGAQFQERVSRFDENKNPSEKKTQTCKFLFENLLGLLSVRGRILRKIQNLFKFFC